MNGNKKNLPSIFQYRDYEWIEAKTKEERKASCHISPKGKWELLRKAVLHPRCYFYGGGLIE